MKGKILQKFLSPLLIAGIFFPSFIVSLEEAHASSIWDIFTSDKPENHGGVLVLIDQNLLDESGRFRSVLTQYENHVSQKLQSPITEVIISPEISVKEIWEGISSLYFSAIDQGKRPWQGLIIVGNIPLPVIQKKGHHWISIFPYTDLKDSSYTWDQDHEKFLFDPQLQGDGLPELWHGIIRSNATTPNLQQAEIIQYLEKNDQVHRGEINFSKNIFYGDFASQPLVAALEPLSGYLLRQKYDEDWVYGRFIRKFLSTIQKERTALSQKYEDIFVSDIPSELIPDVQTSDLLQTFLPQYLDVYIDWVKNIEKRITALGRWQETDIDLLPEMVTRKDELSRVMLRNFNDALEEKLLEVIKKNRVASHIGVQKNQWVYEYDEEGELDKTWLEPLYWNGIKREGMTAQDCTLHRGQGDRTFSQMVEANRTMDPETDDCAYFAEPQSSRNNDPYEGCCGVHVTFDAQTGTFGYNYCRAQSKWISGEDFSPYHDGAQSPIFSYRGTRPADGPIGASGCASILATNELEEWQHEEGGFRFDSLMVHDLPKDQTLATQYEEGLGIALPVDDPRGFSFYDHGIAAHHSQKNPQDFFHFIPFFNIFDQKGLVKDFYAQQKPGSTLIHEGATDVFREKIAEILQAQAQKINTIVRSGNQISRQQFEKDQAITWPIDYYEPPEAPDGGNIDGDCSYTRTTETQENNTKKIRWEEECKYAISITTESSSEDEEGNTTTQSSTQEIDSITSKRAVERFYSQGQEIPQNFFTEVLDAAITTNVLEEDGESFRDPDDRFIKKALEALVWWGLSIDEKNRRATEVALSEQEKFQKFFGRDDFQGYEIMVLKGQGNQRDGMIMRFLPEITQSQSDQDFQQAQEAEQLFQQESTEIGKKFLGISLMGALLPQVWDFTKNKLGAFSVSTIFPQKESTKKESSPRMTRGQYTGEIITSYGQKEEKITIPDKNQKSDGLRILHGLGDGKFRQIKDLNIIESTTTPIDFQIQMLQGQKVNTQDSLTNISFSLYPASAKKFVNFSPKTNRVKSGIANFTFNFSGLKAKENFEIIIVTEHGSKKIPVKVSPYAPQILSTIDEVSADHLDEGILLEVGLFDGKGHPVRDREAGRELFFESKDGTFQPQSIKLNDPNSPASVRFFPKKEAKNVVVYLRDKKFQLPDTARTIKILPGKPSALKTEKSSSALLAGVATGVSFALSDRFGNNIPHHDQRITIQPGDGISIIESEKLDIDPQVPGIQIQTYDGADQIAIIKNEEGTDTTLQIASDAIGKKGVILSFYEPEDPFLKAQMLQKEAIAGQEKPGKILVIAQDRILKNGQITEKKISGKTLVSVRAQPEGILENLPESVWIEDGNPGVIDFTTGNRAGKVTLTLSSIGMEPWQGEFEIYPEKAAKIQLTPEGFLPEKPFFLASEAGTGKLGIEAIDRFGNRATAFSQKVLLRISGSAENLGIPQTLEVEVKNGYGQVDFDFSGGEWQFPTVSDFSPYREGDAAIKIIGDSGLMRIWAGHENLTPGTTEILLSDTLKSQDLEALHPESLITFALGFGAGDLNAEENWASRFLMSGHSQVVVTESAPEETSLQIGGLDKSGFILGDLIAQIQEGPQFRINLQSQKDFLSPVVGIDVPFTEKLPIKLDQDITSKGIYITAESQDILYLQDQTLFISGIPAIQFSQKNGVKFLTGDIDLTRPQDKRQNIFTWNLQKSGQKIATIRWIDQQRDFLWTQSPKAAPYQTDDSIRFYPLKSGIRGLKRYTGSSTNEPKGFLFYDFLRESNAPEKLGNKYASIENAQNQEGVLWDADFRPNALLASGNFIGESLLPGASDALLTFGDPSLKLSNATTSKSVYDEALGIGDENLNDQSGSLGEIIWQGQDENIEGIFSGNFVTPKDIMLWLSDGKLQRLRHQEGEWYEDEIIWSLGFGTKALQAFDFQDDGDQDFLSLDYTGKLSILKNQKGLFEKESIALPLDKKLQNIALGSFNEDDFSDLVFVDQDHQIWLAYGRAEGFLEPIFVDQVLPTFLPTEETASSSSTGNLLNEILVAHSRSTHNLVGKEFLIEGKPHNFWMMPDVFMDAKLQINSTRNDQKIQVGDIVKGKISFQAPQSLQDVKWLFPLWEGMELVPESLVCKKCAPNGADIAMPTVIGNIFSIEALPANQKLSIEFDLRISELGQLPIQISDKNQDGLDDIIITRKNDTGESFLKVYYTEKVAKNSDAQRISTSPNSKPSAIDKITKSLISIGIVAKGIEFLSGKETLFSQKKIETVISPQVEALPSPETQTQKNIPTTTGTKDATTQQESSALSDARQGQTAQKTAVEAQKPEAKHPASWGGIHNQPRGSASTAPGYETIYTPPITSPGSMGQGKESLTYAFPTTGPKCRPVISAYPNLRAGHQESACQTSVIRKYTIPVTPYGTAKVLCWNKFDQHFPVTKDFEGKANCILTNRSTPPKPSLNPVNQVNADSLLSKAQTTQSASDGSMVIVVDENNPEGFDIGLFQPKTLQISQIQIPGVDVATRWLQLQTREILRNNNNAAQSLIMPQVPQAPTTENTTTESIETGGVMEQIYAALTEQPFFRVEMEKVSLPYLEITPERLQQETQMYQKWKTREQEKLQSFLSHTSCRDDLKKECKTVSEKVQTYLQAIDRNREQMKAYLQTTEKLKTYQEKLMALLKLVIKQSALLAEFQQTWFEEIQTDIQDWDKTEQLNARIQQTWQRTVIAPFYGYDMMHRDTVDRGTLLEWLFRDYFGAGKTFGSDNHSIRKNVNYLSTDWHFDSTKPQEKEAAVRIPDGKIDLSNAITATEIKLPFIQLQPIEQEIFAYKDIRYPSHSKGAINNFKAPINAPLPPIPDINFFGSDTIENLQLPGLPQLPPAPKFPEVYAHIPDMVKVAEEKFPLFKALHMGYAVVPEWYVRPFVEQVFNRSTLGDIDLVESGQVNRAQESLSTNIPKDTKNHLIPHESFDQKHTTNTQKPIPQTAEKIQDSQKNQQKSLEDTFRRDHCGFEDISRCGIDASSGSSFYSWDQLLPILRDKFVGYTPKTEKVAQERQAFIAEADRLLSEVSSDFYTQKLQRYFTTEKSLYENFLSQLESTPITNPSHTGVIASLVSLPRVQLVSPSPIEWFWYDTPSTPKSTAKIQVFSSISTENTNTFTPPLTGIFRIEKDGVITKVTDFPLTGNVKILSKDLDDDRKEDLFISEKNSLYLKRSSPSKADKKWNINSLSGIFFQRSLPIADQLKIQGQKSGVKLDFIPHPKAETYTIEIFNSEKKQVKKQKILPSEIIKNSPFWKLPEGSYTMHITAYAQEEILGTRENLKFTIQKPLDLSSPRIKIKGGEKQVFFPLEPIEIDISKTIEPNIQAIWWDLDLSSDSDGDGNPTNDIDLPTENSSKNPEDLKRISLQPLQPGKNRQISVSIRDQNGQIAHQEISLRSLDPYIQIDLLSAKKGAIEGRVDQENQQIQIYRLREGKFEKVRNPIDAGNLGYFSLTDLKKDDYFEIREIATEKTIIQVFSSGRVLVHDDRYGFVIEGATADHSMRIRLRDAQNTTIGYISLTDKNLQKNFAHTQANTYSEWEKFIANHQESLSVYDRFPEDRFEWKYLDTCQKYLTVSCDTYPEAWALIDTSLQKSETIGILDGYGDFYPTSGRSTLRLERARDTKDRPIFQIWVDGDAVANFVP